VYIDEIVWINLCYRCLVGR